MKQPVRVSEAAAMVPQGTTVRGGGFMGVSNPHRIIDELVRQDRGGLALYRSPTGSARVKRCTRPVTSVRRVDLLVTELPFIQPTPDGLILREAAPGATVQQVMDATDVDLTLDAALRQP